MSTKSKNYVEFVRERERQVVEMRAQGLKWREIGDQLNMTEQAARNCAKRHEARMREAAE